MADDQNPLLPLGPNGSDGNPPDSSATRLIPINIEEEMKRSYLDYSMSVIIGRALPDIRDVIHGLDANEPIFNVHTLASCGR